MAKQEKKSNREYVRKFREKTQKMVERAAGAKESGEPLETYDRPSRVIQRRVYKFTRWVIEDPQRIEQLIKRLNKAEISIRKDSNIFVLAHQYLFLGSEFGQDYRSRHETSVQLMYAYKHNVETRWLAPFLMQVGGYKKIKDRPPEYREPWLDSELDRPARKLPSMQKLMELMD